MHKSRQTIECTATPTIQQRRAVMAHHFASQRIRNAKNCDSRFNEYSEDRMNRCRRYCHCGSVALYYLRGKVTCGEHKGELCR